MKTANIKELKAKGLSNDSIYQIVAGNLNLFGVAFFGHNGRPGDKQKLSRAWKKILSIN